jgi:hypothetical protein
MKVIFNPFTGTFEFIETGSGAPGGLTGDIQYNNAGSFGGFSVGGDGTLNPTTGALTVTKSNGTPFGTAAFADTSDFDPFGAASAAVSAFAATLGTLAYINDPLPVNKGGTGTASPGLIAGTNVSISGAWPNQTINSTGGGGGSPGGADGQWQYNNSGAFGGLAGTGVDGTTNIPWDIYGIDVGTYATGSYAPPAWAGGSNIPYVFRGSLLADHALISAAPGGNYRVASCLLYCDDTNAADTSVGVARILRLSATVAAGDVGTGDLIGLAATIDSSGDGITGLNGADYLTINRVPAVNGVFLSGFSMGVINTAGAAVSGAYGQGGSAYFTNSEPTADFTDLYGLDLSLDLHASATYGTAAVIRMANNYAGADALLYQLSGTEKFAVDGKGNMRLFGGAGLGSGDGVITAKNATTPPTTDPTNGYLMWAEGGAAKMRGTVGGDRFVAGYKYVLQANTNFYVRDDGNNANDGLSNTAGGAWATPGFASSMMAFVDANDFEVTIIITGSFAAGAGVDVMPVIYRPKNCKRFTIDGQELTVFDGVDQSANGLSIGFNTELSSVLNCQVDDIGGIESKNCFCGFNFFAGAYPWVTHNLVSRDNQNGLFVDANSGIYFDTVLFAGAHSKLVQCQANSGMYLDNGSCEVGATFSDVVIGITTTANVTLNNFDPTNLSATGGAAQWFVDAFCKLDLGGATLPGAAGTTDPLGLVI